MFERKKTYNFNTLAPSILGARYENMKVVSILDISDAMKIENVISKHANLLTIIDNLPKDPGDCDFISFMNSSGDIVLLANEYIDQNSIEVVTTFDLNLTIPNVTTEDTALVMAILKQHGYNNVIITN